MEKLKGHVAYFYKHHLIRYLIVGGTSFIIDEGLLIILHGKFNMWLPFATFIAYLVAFIYNFSLNRWWAFSAAENNTLREHIVPYTILFIFNLVFNVAFVSIASHVINFAVAKALAVIIQISWTYLIYKNVIFTQNTTPVTE